MTTPLHTLLTNAANALQEGINELVQSHTDPTTGLLDCPEVTLKVEAEQDLVNQLRAAAEQQAQATPAAWLHDVVAEDGELDQALSFSRDNFPLQGVGGFRSVCARPLAVTIGAAPPTGFDAEFLSKRLARVAELAGVSIPAHMTHEQVAEFAGTVLGDIARKLATPAALPAPVQEPVALTDAVRAEPTEMIHKWRVLELIKDHNPPAAQPAVPAAQRQWVGLTPEEVVHVNTVREAEALLREKNAALPAPVQEPVAWRARDANGKWMYGDAPAPELPGDQPEFLGVIAATQLPSEQITAAQRLIDADMAKRLEGGE